MQSTRGQGYKKRFSSWYDQCLVTKEGEDILRDFDDSAIKHLRKHFLIWSSWIAFKPHFSAFSPNLPDHSYRRIALQSPSVLHKFFVSLAWRSCASKLPDMDQAYAGAEKIELMRQAIVSDAELDCTFFPVSLTQLTTRGTIHNSTPLRDTVIPPDGLTGYLPEQSWEIIRIYFDGLIAHVHLDPDKAHAKDNPLFIGSKDIFVVSGVTYEASYQYENLLVNAWETRLPFGTLSHN